MAMQNLGSPMGLGFPISNYTMSLALLKRIDFWDTSADAIGEDFHMFVKAYFKTHGQVGQPLPCAPLQLHIVFVWNGPKTCGQFPAAAPLQLYTVFAVMLPNMWVNSLL